MRHDQLDEAFVEDRNQSSFPNTSIEINRVWMRSRVQTQRNLAPNRETTREVKDEILCSKLVFFPRVSFKFYTNALQSCYTQNQLFTVPTLHTQPITHAKAQEEMIIFCGMCASERGISITSSPVSSSSFARMLSTSHPAGKKIARWKLITILMV